MSDPEPRPHFGAPGRQHPAAPEPPLAERARTLLHIARFGTFSTQSRRHAGFPFGSLTPYAADSVGRPVFLISSLAVHTDNLKADRHASLLILQPEIEGELLGASRLTLLGEVAPVPETELDSVRESYLARYESARGWVSYGDFAFYRMEVLSAYHVAGFGVMGWISPEQYRTTQPDPLAEAASQILNHMNAHHGAELRQIARIFGNETADEAIMISVDRLGFWIRLRIGEQYHGIRIAFPREVRDTQQARTVLVEMSHAARDTGSAGYPTSAG